jgi:hypothetical protein
MKWFHHDTDMHRNRKIRKLIRVHGATGYAFWCVLLEKLYEAEGGFQIQADELWFEDIAEDLKLADYRTPIRILDTLAELSLIDTQLWAEHTIYAPSIASRGDHYVVKRTQETEKKRRYREKKKTLSTVDTPGTKGQTPVLSPSDPDPDSDTDPDPETDQRSLSIPEDPTVRVGDKNSTDSPPDPQPTAPPEQHPPLAALSGFGHQSSAAACEARFAAGNQLPPWRKGRGPNDFDPVVVDRLHAWMQSMNPGTKRMRADAISYIRKREIVPGSGEWNSLLDRVNELMGVTPEGSPLSPAKPAVDISAMAIAAINARLESK